jgi:hypothetical protein
MKTVNDRIEFRISDLGMSLLSKRLIDVFVDRSTPQKLSVILGHIGANKVNVYLSFFRTPSNS